MDEVFKAIVGVIVVCFVGLGVIGMFRAIFRVLGAGVSTVKAVGKTAAGEGSLSENLDAEFKRMSDFSIQLIKKSADDEMPFERYEILGKGLFPNQNKTQLNFVTRLADNTEKNDPKPIISTVDAFQSDDNPFYEFKRKGMVVESGYGFLKPVPVGIVIPEVLVPPKSGSRDILFIFQILDSNQNELGRYSITQKIEFEEEGYEEAIETREEVFLLDIQIAMHVAFSDNEFHKKEGEVIKSWMIKILDSFGGEGEREEGLKKRFNETFKESYGKAKTGNLTLAKITNRINEIANDQLKYQAIELCLDVMAADGIADEGELEDIRKICDYLDLDLDVVQKLKDARMKDVKMRVTSDTSLEELIGIQPERDKEQIKRFLKDEFKKWNSRIASANSPDERESTQEKLDLIAELREKYDK